MKKTIVSLLFLFIVAFGGSVISETKWKVPVANFDGSKFATRYGLDIDKDFSGIRDDAGQLWLIYNGDVPLPDDPPVFEVSDTTKRDRLSVLRENLRSRDLNISELNEYLRLTAGL